MRPMANGDDVRRIGLALAETTEDAAGSRYDGYPAILVRLPPIDDHLLRLVVTDAWRIRAPQRLAAQAERERHGDR